jgi:hypothetical protein
MAYTLIVLNSRYNYTGRIKEEVGRYAHAAKANFDKVCFVAGYAMMQLRQTLYGKQRMEMPALIQNKVLEGTEEELNQTIAIGSANSVERIKTAAYDTIDPIQRGLSAENPLTEGWMRNNHLPVQLLQPRFREIYTFIVDSKLYQQAEYYGHPIVFDDRREEILIKVNGVYRPSKYILRNFRLDNVSSRERLFIHPFIVCKETERRYAYLQRGLTLHDSEKDIRAYKKLPVNERPNKPQLIAKFCLIEKLESPKDVDDMTYHSWCEVIDRSGNCYSFGFYGQGIVKSPDPTEFSKKNIKSLAFEIDDHSRITAFVRRHRAAGPGRYHFTKYNCASFTRDVCSLMNIQASEKSKVREFGGIVMQIRMYAMASLLAASMRKEVNKNKIVAVEELATVVDILNKVPIIGKHLVEKFSVEQSMESISVKKTLTKNPGMREHLMTQASWLKQSVRNSDAQALTDQLNEVPISAFELKKLCQSILHGSQQDLAYKLFNLFNDFYTRHIDYELGLPTTLFTGLEKIHKQREFSFSVCSSS